MKRFVLLMGLLFAIFSVTSAQDSGELYVNAGNVMGEISPYVYGANFGGYGAISADLMEEAQNSGITFFRSPGGRWGDINDITEFHLDTWKLYADIVGTEMSIHVRLENGTPSAAAELVRLANVEKEMNIRYWYIGNEPNLFDDYTTDEFNVQWREIATAMLEVDPDIILVGPDVSQWNDAIGVSPDDENGKDWLVEFLRANGDLVDIVSVHRYPFPQGQNRLTTIDDLRNDSQDWSLLLPRLREIIFEETGRADVGVAVTEVNSHWSAGVGGEAGNDSFYNAIWWADVLARLIQHDPEIVAFFDFQSTSSRGGWGLLERYEVRPTYYVYQIYQRFGNMLVESQSSDNLVTVYAAKREDGALTIIVINMADDEQTRSLTIENFDSGGEAEVWRLDPEHNATQIDNADLSSGEVILSAQSITLYILPSE